MPSESVWFEEVDTAFLLRLRSVIQLPNSRGVLVPVPCKVRKPDEDFKVEQYPCTTIYNLSSARDNFRYYPDTVVVSRDTEHKSLVAENSAIPYTLTYQLDFWARLQYDMNEMTRLWLGHYSERYFNLDVFDKSGVARSCFVAQSGNLVKSDFLSGAERTFHSILTYKVSVELDEKISSTIDMVVTTESNVHNHVEQEVS